MHVHRAQVVRMDTWPFLARWDTNACTHTHTPMHRMPWIMTSLTLVSSLPSPPCLLHRVLFWLCVCMCMCGRVVSMGAHEQEGYLGRLGILRHQWRPSISGVTLTSRPSSWTRWPCKGGQKACASSAEQTKGSCRVIALLCSNCNTSDCRPTPAIPTPAIQPDSGADAPARLGCWRCGSCMT